MVFCSMSLSRANTFGAPTTSIMSVIVTTQQKHDVDQIEYRA